ncbi:MAG: hypothetical protein IJK18_00740 [Clostridia bacterium]|nr:hypothetical protein [Clostridia bacterium]
MSGFIPGKTITISVFDVKNKLPWAAIDVRNMSREDNIPEVVFTKLTEVRYKKQQLEPNYDGIISNTVMVFCKTEDSSKILECIGSNFKLKTNLSDTLIFYIS